MAVTTIIENMVAAQALPPTLAVFIPSVERDAEYIGRKQTRFINALADELVPLIRKRYGSAPAPSRCGTIGISSGGDIALASVSAWPDVFGVRDVGTITPVLSSLLTCTTIRSAADIPSLSAVRPFRYCL
jgi:enterochelin esterase-like enzyme